MSFITLYVTHPDQETAQSIAEQLLKKKLIACVNYFPIQSSYRRKGEIAHTNEIVTLLKTKTENREIVKNEIIKIHPHKTPCIIKFSAEANDSYEKRIETETN